jgi:hypothetical protein
MNTAHPNYTIVVNWMKKGFGCAKVCSYCNWRDSPLLPHGGQSADAISAFIKQCRKPFITISGGADPLFRIADYGDQLMAMTAVINAHGLNVRVITREVQHIAKLRGIVDYFSVSLDEEVLADLTRYQGDWAGLDIEYSLVLPPLPTADLVRLKPQYAALYRQLGRRLVFRENLNSLYFVDMKALSFGHTGIVFVPKALCLDGRYLSTIDCTGHDLVQDHRCRGKKPGTTPRQTPTDQPDRNPRKHPHKTAKKGYQRPDRRMKWSPTIRTIRSSSIGKERIWMCKKLLLLQLARLPAAAAWRSKSRRNF